MTEYSKRKKNEHIISPINLNFLYTVIRKKILRPSNFKIIPVEVCSITN